MACKGCKDKKPVEIENNVSFKDENGVRKYSFPKWGLVVEGKNMIEAVEKAREIMKAKEKSVEEKVEEKKVEEEKK